MHTHTHTYIHTYVQLKTHIESADWWIDCEIADDIKRDTQTDVGEVVKTTDEL